MHVSVITGWAGEGYALCCDCGRDDGKLAPIFAGSEWDNAPACDKCGEAIDVQVIEEPREERAAYAWPGGYPLVYVMGDGEILCPDCANGKNGSEADDSAETPDEWRIVGAQIHWEGEAETCAHCGAEIDSAYGVPE